MFSGQTNNLPYIHNYADAKKWWDEHPKPPRSRKWDDHQRPLYNTAAKHYRLESMSPDEYIDVVLYHTVMARYYAPTPDRKQRRLYVGHGSITSRSFMSRVLGVSPWRNTESTPDGGKVIAPIYCNSFMSDGGHAFSADFMFDANNRLLVDESRHTKHWRSVSDENDRVRRGAVRDMFQPYLDIALFRMAEFEASVEIDWRAGKPFGANTSGKRNQSVFNMYQALLKGELPKQEDIDVFFVEAQAAFNGLASKRAYKQKGFVLETWYTKQQNKTPGTYADLEKPITGAELRKALENKVIKVCGASVRTGRVLIPQFPSTDDYPCSNVLVGENP